MTQALASPGVRLSVNVNKVALLRNARGGNVPNVLKVAQDAVRFGAQGITVHPRPDGRHIRYSDVRDLAAAQLGVEFNVEGYPTQDFIQLVLAAKPAQVTLVPDPPEALTSSAGWDLPRQQDVLKAVVPRFKEAGIRVSIFVETALDALEYAQQTGTDCVELYTGPYAEAYAAAQDIDARVAATAPFAAAATRAHELGLSVNAGHDLNQQNIRTFVQHVPHVQEVSIGHALIAEALYDGLARTIQAYRIALG